MASRSPHLKYQASRLWELMSLAGLVWLTLGLAAWAQAIEKPTALQFKYAPSFHGTIEIWVTSEEGGGYSGSVLIYRKRPQDTQVAVRRELALTPAEMAPILEFVNAAETRSFFAVPEVFVRRDGSISELSVQQGGFGITLRTVKAFDKDAAPQDRRMGAILLELLAKARLKLPENQQY